MNPRDLDGVMAAYVPDDSLFVFDVVPLREYVGYKAYRDDWKGFLGACTAAQPLLMRPTFSPPR